MNDALTEDVLIQGNVNVVHSEWGQDVKESSRVRIQNRFITTQLAISSDSNYNI